MTLLGRERETGEARGVQREAGREEVDGWVGGCLPCLFWNGLGQCKGGARRAVLHRGQRAPVGGSLSHLVTPMLHSAFAGAKKISPGIFDPDRPIMVVVVVVGGAGGALC